MTSRADNRPSTDSLLGCAFWALVGGLILTLAALAALFVLILVGAIK